MVRRLFDFLTKEYKMTIEIDVEIEELPQLLIEIARLISEGFTSGYLLDGYWSIQK